MIIEHGVLIAGILSKDTLGNKTGSLMHVIAAEFSYDVARDFYGNIQKVVNNFLMIEGHSIGIGDTIADTDTYNDIQRTIRQAKVTNCRCKLVGVAVYSLLFSLLLSFPLSSLLVPPFLPPLSSPPLSSPFLPPPPSPSLLPPLYSPLTLSPPRVMS